MSCLTFEIKIPLGYDIGLTYLIKVAESTISFKGNMILVKYSLYESSTFEIKIRLGCDLGSTYLINVAESKNSLSGTMILVKYS